MEIKSISLHELRKMNDCEGDFRTRICGEDNVKV